VELYLCSPIHLHGVVIKHRDSFTLLPFNDGHRNYYYYYYYYYFIIITFFVLIELIFNIPVVQNQREKGANRAGCYNLA
jgi:hypothetical protein